eukprot:CAMPEP_0116140418 /NCGR_PEP_ID=MMETSP0329-20121206/13832_1 /TAXON_ID=697910 /ORGANISM="Pseudo-nitzschia arenysensis, Strain B593" /LENGTH=125 /DNA_ID=CAMNT_0003635521 /DNA_START=65 /DNA_END=442 /DNA_ORIENTATION=+
MRSDFLRSILCVALLGCSLTEAFRSSPMQTKIATKTTVGEQSTLLFAEGFGEKEDTEKKVETVANPEDIEDLPMFSLEYNSDNVDYSQLPVPPFTSALIFIVSMAFTIYLYYVGITGGTAAPPSL